MPGIDWIELEEPSQLDELKIRSVTKDQVIFKHSTRCATSSLAKDRLERKANPDNIDFYFLDLLRHRQLSDQIAEDFQVYHESPQVLLIRNASCIYEESHNAINMDEIAELSVTR